MDLVTRRKVDDGIYEVWALGLCLGVIRYNPDAWAHGRWFIDGDRRETSTHGNTYSTIRKPVGWPTLKSAVEKVAKMSSGRIVAEICNRS